MIDEVKAGRICDTLAVKLDSTVQALNTALQAGNKLVDLRTTERDFKATEAEGLRLLIKQDEAIHKDETKELRKQRNRLFILSVAELLVIVLLI